MSGNRHNQRGRTRQQQPQSGGKKPPRGAGVYPPTLEPVALPGDYVRLEPDKGTYQVELIEAIPGIDVFDSDQGNSVTASSNSTTSDKDATELEQKRDNWLGQHRLVRPGVDIPDGIDEVQVDHGGGQAPLWTSAEARGYIDSDFADLAGYTGIHEFYTWGDTAPKFTFVNNQGSDITVQDIQFAGYHFKLRPNVRVPNDVQPVVLPVEAVSSVG